jgi:hypothetical protein
MSAALAWAGQPSEQASSKKPVPEPTTKVRVCKSQCGRCVNLVFVYDRNTFDLHDRCFSRLLFDTPKAVLFKNCASYLSEDDNFLYYLDQTFEREMAFGKCPEDTFAGHAIWSRRVGTSDWELLTIDAVMASPRVITTPCK